MKSLVKIYKRMNGGMKFFIFILFCYSLLFISNYDLAKKVCLNFLVMAEKIVPLLVFVFVIMVIVDMVFTTDRTLKHLGADSGIKSWVYAIIGGILISGPPYVQYPMLSELKKKGMNDSLIAVFLFNRNVKIAFFPALIYYFEIKYAVILSLYIILFSIFNGLLIRLFVKQE